MAEPTAGDVAFACIRTLIDQLARRGVSEACVSPGSRSTPVALALARDDRIQAHVHLDERSSSFFALGLAKASGRPVIVTCTSGTAVANLLPAVVEASLSGVPLILLTADRPPELRGTGANQTIDQVGIFGPYPRWAVDARVPEASADAAHAWRTLADRAADAAVGPPPGPVHVNLPFREPLVPTGAPVDLGPDRVEPARQREAMTGARPAQETIEPLLDQMRSDRGLILVGGASAGGGVDASIVDAFSSATGWPALAEPHSGAGSRRPSRILAGQHLLADAAFVDACAPDVVLQVGAPPTSRAGQAIVARAPMLVVVVPAPSRADPSGRPAVHVDAEPDAILREAVERTTPRGEATEWATLWAEADGAARTAVDAVLDAYDEPFEGRIARDLFAALPEGSTLFAGSSMPIRDLDAYAMPRSTAGVRVLANRGASGIDGSVSTTLGIAASGARTFALIGDLALLHDAAGLLWSARRRPGAVFVVPNNDGGGIFDNLAIAHEPEHERMFVTPHGLDLSELARAAGARHERVEHAPDLTAAVAAASASSRAPVRIVEVVVDRAVGLKIRRVVRDEVRGALAALGYA